MNFLGGVTAVVWLVLTVADGDTGEYLYRYETQMDWFSVSGDRIEDCRIHGVTLGKRLANLYREKGHPNAFANVDCEWRPGKPQNPA